MIFIFHIPFPRIILFSGIIFGGRGVHRRNPLPLLLQHDRPPTGHDHGAGHSEKHRDYRHGWHWHQPVSGEGRHGHRCQAYPHRQGRSPHCRTGRAQLPGKAVGARAADGLWYATFCLFQNQSSYI